MKKIISVTEKFTPFEATYDPELDIYTNISLFPKKVEKATEILKELALPKIKKKGKKPPLSPLQNELLTIYTFDPTEQQMQQLKDFLAQLFADKFNESKAKQEIEMVV
jgi:hypothetical protein